MWPQMTMGKVWPDNPFVLVGASTITKNGSRIVPSYSNFGSCNVIFAHGGPNAAWHYEHNTYFG
jgi:hypothetical protein